MKANFKFILIYLFKFLMFHQHFINSSKEGRLIRAKFYFENLLHNADNNVCEKLINFNNIRNLLTV